MEVLHPLVLRTLDALYWTPKGYALTKRSLDRLEADLKAMTEHDDLLEVLGGLIYLVTCFMESGHPRASHRLFEVLWQTWSPLIAIAPHADTDPRFQALRFGFERIPLVAPMFSPVATHLAPRSYMGARPSRHLQILEKRKRLGPIWPKK